MNVNFIGALVLGAQGLEPRDVSVCEGRLVERAERSVNVGGFQILPGIIDLHGDGFERHVAPRRGAMKDVAEGLRAAEVEMAACGVTTGFIAQFISWEGGLRGLEFADQVFSALRDLDTITDMRPQVRLETHMLELYGDIPEWMRKWCADYIVFNDHLPHERLAQGRHPKRLVGQALKAGRSPEKQFEMLMEMHARGADVPAALDVLCARLREQGIRMGSHDDRSSEQRDAWNERGVEIAEFPETVEASEAKGATILGAPNVMRGGSHKGNQSALDAVLMGHCDALASDYHYPSLGRAALFLGKTIGLKAAWDLVSDGPARILGLQDRGKIAAGLRADLVFYDPDWRVAGTMSRGQFSFLRGDLAQRLVNG